MRLVFLLALLALCSAALMASHVFDPWSDPTWSGPVVEGPRQRRRHEERVVPPIPWSHVMQPVAEGANRFAIELHRTLADDGKSVAFSPFSIHSTLAMTATGARGQTFEQMLTVLHLPDREALAAAGDLARFYAGGDRPYELAVASAVWGQRGVRWNPGFVALLDDRFSAGFHEADFLGDVNGERLRINAWVAERTRERIPALVESLDADSRLLLASAIYFKGDWKYSFDPSLTGPLPFHRGDGTLVDVPMMYRRHGYDYAEEGDVQLLALPYVGDEIEMTVLLPREPDGLPALERRLTADALLAMRLAARHFDVRVHLPRFRIDHGFDSSVPLASLGMADAFDPASADFLGMVDDAAHSPSLHVKRVVHKAFIDVNEEGTEAAAATALVAGPVSARVDRSVEFRADRPFLFFIRDALRGTILFVGRYAGP